MKKAKRLIKEEVTEELEIEKELQQDISPIQDKVDCLFTSLEESEGKSSCNKKELIMEVLEKYSDDGVISEDRFDDLVDSITEVTGQ